MYLDINKNDHVAGNEEAAITLLEYGDYQCPYCKKAYYIIKEIMGNSEKHIEFVFRNFPLTQIHPNAFHAALAAEAAAKQDKFWEMHDILFENQRLLDYEYLVKYAKQLELDISQFENDFESESGIRKIKEDFNSGLHNGVEGTPTFFVNGDKFDGNWMSAEFTEYLKTAGK